jgi:hypothetical protein
VKEKSKEVAGPVMNKREWREREAEREKERRATEREERQMWNALGMRYRIRDYYKYRSRDLNDQHRVEKEQEAKSEVVRHPPSILERGIACTGDS